MGINESYLSTSHCLKTVVFGVKRRAKEEIGRNSPFIKGKCETESENFKYCELFPFPIFLL